MYVCMYAHIYVCMHVCMYACMYVCMYVCSMYVYTYMYIYRGVHSPLPSRGSCPGSGLAKKDLDDTKLPPVPYANTNLRSKHVFKV